MVCYRNRIRNLAYYNNLFAHSMKNCTARFKEPCLPPLAGRDRCYNHEYV